MTVRVIRVVPKVRIFLRRLPRRALPATETRPVSGKWLVDNIHLFHKMTPEDIEDLEQIIRLNRQVPGG